MRGTEDGLEESYSKLSPCLMFGRKPRFPVDILFGRGQNGENQDYTTYISKLRDRLKYTYELASSTINQSSKDNKRRYDRRMRDAVP